MRVKKVWRRLYSKWYVFLAWAVLSIIIWTWICYFLTLPKEEEKMGVFVCSTACDQTVLVGKLQSERPLYVRNLDFKWVSPEDTLFPTYYDAFAVETSDLIVMPADKLNEYSYVDFFPLDRDAVEETFKRTFEYYSTKDGKLYGIKFNAEISLGKQSDEREYYLFFNKNSKHLGEWNSCPRSGALALAQAII